MPYRPAHIVMIISRKPLLRRLLGSGILRAFQTIVIASASGQRYGIMQDRAGDISAASLNGARRSAYRAPRATCYLVIAPYVLLALFVFGCIAFPPQAHSEGVQHRHSELSNSPAPLPKGRNAPNDMLVPPDRRLGRFDIDLGLPAGGDQASVQTNYMMLNILSSALSIKVITASKLQCSIFLAPAAYPLIQAYMEGSAPRDQVRRICLDAFRRTLSVVEDDDSAIRKAIDDLKTRDTWARGSSAASRSRSRSAISEAVRRVYDEDSTVHALLSVRSTHYASITVAQFRQWMETVRQSGRMRLLTDDPELAAEGDIFERDVNAWHEIPTPKKSIDVIEVNDFGPVDVRVAVLVAVKPPPDGKVRNDAVEKYCRNVRNTKADLRIKPSLGAVSKASFIRRIGFSFTTLRRTARTNLCGGWLPTLLETPPFSLWLP